MLKHYFCLATGLVVGSLALPMVAATATQRATDQAQHSTAVSLADKNAERGQAFLQQNKTKPGVKTTSSGLQYKVLTQGNGPKPKPTDTVEVDYEGRFINGNVFDSSYQRGEPVNFPVNGVIKGWQEALTLMPQGSTWEIFVPADLAYGSRGVPGVIGPNETLIFKVHLIKIKQD